MRTLEAEVLTAGRPGARVLVVEDDIALARLVHTSLSLGGYEVEIAGSVAEARARLRHHESPIDVVVTDVRLPKASGVELLFAEQEGDPVIPLLVVTGFASPGLRKLVEGMGASLLEKPFSLETLHGHVLALLQGRVAHEGVRWSHVRW